MKANEIFQNMTKGEWITTQNHVPNTNPKIKCLAPNDVARTIIGELLIHSAGNYHINENEAQTNAEAICNAVNNTYGKGIDPGVVPEMLKLLQRYEYYFEELHERLQKENGNTQETISAHHSFLEFQSLIEKATLTQSETVNP